MSAPAPGDLDAIERELRDALAPTIQVVRPLGRGAMGAVFLARDPALKRDVVVKVLSPELAHDPVARQRFAREAETAAAVSHPNVVDIFHVGELPRSGTGYFVMQYVQGPTLAEALPLGARVQQARARRIVGEIASALAAAHARALVHRDIKPSNVMLDGPAERVVVLDFGISAAAMSARADGDERLTGQGTSIGTPAYMSPEQAAGDPVTDRSDVYSLGVLAFELLAGEPPFTARSPVALIAAHIKDIPKPIATLRPDLEPTFAALVDRMLAKEPGARPSANEIARALLPTPHVIEWPPPGLESSRGALATGLTLLAAAAIVLPFDLMWGAPAGDVGQLLLDALLAVFTVALLAASGAALGYAVTHGRRAIRSGYPATVAVDALLDREDDTVSLLNGAGPYASLDAAAAIRWLRRRRTAAAVKLAGAAASLAFAILWSLGRLSLADTASGDSMTLAGFLTLTLPVLSGVIIGIALRRPETVFRQRLRATEPVSRRRRPNVPPDLVAAWRTSAGWVSASPGSRRAAVGVAVFEWTCAALIFGGMATVTATSVSSTLGSVSPQSKPLNRYELARLRADVVAATRQPAIDSALALHGVAPANAGGDTAAARAVASAVDAAGVDPSLVWRALSILPRALPADLMAALDTSTRHPALDALRRVAAGGPPPIMWYARTRDITLDRARADWSGANALVRLTTRNAAAATLALARGDAATAERRARENITIGRLLVRDPMPAAYTRGLGIAANAARLLGEIGIAQGDRTMIREAQSLSAAIDGRRAADQTLRHASFARVASRPDDTLLVALAGSPRMLPVDRWTAVEAIARGACWNAAELRTGVSPARRAALEEAAHRLRDLPRSAVWVALLRDYLDAVDRGDPGAGPRYTNHATLERVFPVFGRIVACGGR